jgi:hypothetical protein
LNDTIGDLKKLAAAQSGTRPEKIKIQKWYNIYKDHITLRDYEIHDGMGLGKSLLDLKTTNYHYDTKIFSFFLFYRALL